MTAALAEPVAPPSTATGPTLRSVVRRGRGPVLFAAALGAATVALALATGTGTSGNLDPDSYEPQGSRAVATVLREAGIGVDRVRTVDEALAADRPGRTVLLPAPSLLTLAELRRLAARQGRLVVVEPNTEDLTALGLPVRASGVAPVASRRPACGFEPAQRAGEVDAGGVLYRATAAGVTGCYASGGEASLLVVGGRPGAVVLGSGSLLTNDRLAVAGNAALALALLGSGDGVAWLVPDPARAVPADERPPLTELIPAAIRLGAVQLTVAVAVLALWRARRLGRVVEEPLPVVVRASEAAEGRARLYRAAGARGVAADALRAASRDRLLRRLGLPPSSDRAQLVATAAARTGREPARVDALLYGAAPADDAALVRLADDLRSLEDAVR